VGVQVSKKRTGILAAALIASICGEPAAAANWLEKTFYMIGPRFDSKLPACDDGWALATIRHRFSTKEGRFWNSDLEIVDFLNVREVAFRPWVAGAIPRRFCQADVIISDGAKRPVYYSIVEDGGFISATFGVEWCVVGLDRDWAYNPGCKMARP
jgi:hypothetical protein